MTTSPDQIVFTDRYGDCIDRPDVDVVEIRWFDTTSELDAEGFRAWLSRFADAVESTGRTKILTDSMAFRMDMAHMSGEWRDANIIPRYNAAGVTKFAFVMPEGMPAIGSEPSNEGPAAYLTGYFGGREAALAWLAG